jgi:hypothetical protein
MNSYDQQYTCISKALTFKQLNSPRMKEYTFRNYICFDTFVPLPNKKRIWEKWSVYIPTWETQHHCIFYNKKCKTLVKFKLIFNNDSSL